VLSRSRQCVEVLYGLNEILFVVVPILSLDVKYVGRVSGAMSGRRCDRVVR
jgi:hypothetical protein